MQFPEFFNEPCGHTLVGFKNLHILFLLREPGHANELVGKDDIGNRPQFFLCQVGDTVKFVLVRQGKTVEASLTLKEYNPTSTGDVSFD